MSLRSRGLGATGSALAAAVIVALVVVGGCTVGGGSGSATGTLKVLGCNEGDTLMTEQPYELGPTFFAGEPIEDICPAPATCPGDHANRLLIRMQRTGNQVENNDTLYFDVVNALEVAKCVRGRTLNGGATWDTRFVSNADGSLTDLPWCDWNAVGDGGAGGAAADGGVAPMTAPRARINLSTQDAVRASLAPLRSCVEARLVGVALPGSWIEFYDFGTAAQSDLPAEMRKAVSADFKVNFGERLRAFFHLELGDQRVTAAQQARVPLPPTRISGTLDGSFDFDLARGRAAQPFP